MAPKLAFKKGRQRNLKRALKVTLKIALQNYPQNALNIATPKTHQMRAYLPPADWGVSPGTIIDIKYVLTCISQFHRISQIIYRLIQVRPGLVKLCID